ncbi:hypothetical protein M917_1196 [Psychrobacter aquaticus CMS 56]|uniref:Uncharacterized protein n=1 Tax=Psychrobacter aquaticus CMS 56 TaxID=1354303 RepID=U4T3S6_9GAMM|nr:hypothetical protein M917_1196 [Psychrobacter aquaticus CMS 56]
MASYYIPLRFSDITVNRIAINLDNQSRKQGKPLLFLE